jgi:hypothetical protein
MRIFFRHRIYSPYEPASTGLALSRRIATNETVAAIYMAGTEISLR